MTDRRRPRWVYGAGDEPDPRFSLANERTFLAWVRTALALLAAGVAIEALVLPIEAGFRAAAAAVFVLLGALAAVHAFVTWARTERALRLNRPLPALSLALPLSVGLIVGMLLIAIGFVVK